jgi:hypothetical protein
MSNLDFAERVDLLQREIQPDGLLGDIAMTLVERQDDERLDSSRAVVDAINPPKSADQPEEPRWRRLEDAGKLLQKVANERREDIMSLGEALDIAPTETLPQSKLAKVDPTIVEFIADGGANAQGLVRPNMLEQAAIHLGAPTSVVRVLGGARRIDPTYEDPKTHQMKQNAEHAKIRELAPDFAVEDTQIEHYNNVALARQAGFTIGWRNGELDPSGAAYVTSLHAPYRPLRECVNPVEVKEDDIALNAGLTAIHKMLPYRGDRQGLTGKQLVIATNGQYSMQRELFAREWARKHGVELGGETVVLGDAPGWRTPHKEAKGGFVATANRTPLAILNEITVTGRWALNFANIV